MVSTTLHKRLCAAFAAGLIIAALGACGSIEPKSGAGSSAAKPKANGDGFGSDAVGQDGSGSDATPGAGSGSGTASGSGSTQLTDVAAFEKTVYPIVRQYCAAGCHESSQTPFFAAKTAVAALKAIQESGKVNFDVVDDSRLVKRLGTDMHHCWTACEKDAGTMRAAIVAWLELAKKREPATPKIISDGHKLKDAVERDKEGDPMTLAAEAESGTLTAPMATTMNTAVSGGKFISAPTTATTVIGANANTAGLGAVVYNFDVKSDGTYAVWGLVNAPAATSNRFFVRVDAGAFATWTITANADKFTWTKVAGAKAAPFSATLTAGAHTVEIRHSRPGTNLDVIALTANTAFDGSQAVFGKIHVLHYDLSKVKPGVALEIEMEDFNDGAYKFRNPRLLTTSDAHVKGLRVLVNGTYDPEEATYNLLDQKVSAPGALLSPAALVVIKDKGAEDDEITFQFDVLE